MTLADDGGDKPQPSPLQEVSSRACRDSSMDRRTLLLPALFFACSSSLLRPLEALAQPPRTVMWPPFAPTSGYSRDGPPWGRKFRAPTGTGTGEQGVRRAVSDLVSKDYKTAGALLRLAFHDAISRDTESGEGGANGSILWELGRQENYGLYGAVDVLEPIHSMGGLSWADTIAVAGSQAVTSSGGPYIQVQLGREDAKVPDPQNLTRPVGKCDEALVAGGGRDCRGVAEKTIPGAGLNSDGLRNFFGRFGFSDEEVVALMGGHTIGRFSSLLGVPKECLRNLGDRWLECLPLGERLPFTKDPDSFTNSYYKYLLLWYDRSITPGDAHFLPSDVVIVVDDAFRRHVQAFADDEKLFFRTFEKAYTRLVSIGA